MSTAAGIAHPITPYGQAILHQACAPVTQFDESLAALVLAAERTAILAAAALKAR